MIWSNLKFNLPTKRGYLRIGQHCTEQVGWNTLLPWLQNFLCMPCSAGKGFSFASMLQDFGGFSGVNKVQGGVPQTL